MISDLQLATLAAAAYEGVPTWQVRDAFVYQTLLEDAQVIAFRGTNPEHLADLLADLDAVPVSNDFLGTCHAGFLANVLGIADLVMEETRGARIIVTGHSKGAAEAVLFAGLLAAHGRPPIQVSTFGMPRPAFGTLRGLLSTVPGADYRHGCDPVTEVPIGFQHPRPIVQLGSPDLTLDPIADHMIAAYQGALSSLGSATIAA